MESLRIRKDNPFGKLRYNAKRAVIEMYKIQSDEVQLPKLEAWIEKKQSTVPYSWNKRYVIYKLLYFSESLIMNDDIAKNHQFIHFRWAIVRGSFLLWSHIQRVIRDPRDAKERKKFHHINLMQMIQVLPIHKGKTQRKFAIEVTGARGTRKVYWRCVNRYDRDYWVKSLKLHIEHVKRMVTYLGTTHVQSESVSLPSAIMVHHELLV